jgi:hypothetical protein
VGNIAAMQRCDTSAAQESDRAQAAYFLDELQRQVRQLDEDTAKLQGLMVHYQRRNLRLQVARIQRELRRAALQRREILNMASALSCRFKP